MWMDTGVNKGGGVCANALPKDTQIGIKPIKNQANCQNNHESK